MTHPDFQPIASFIWSVADLLRGPYRPPQYERVMLPLTVLRRFDCVLAPTKALVLERHQKLSAGGKLKNLDAVLNAIPKDTDGRPLGFHNHSLLDFQRLTGDPDNVARHLQDYIAGFSANVRRIFEYFDFDKEIEKLDEANRLYEVVRTFAAIDLHPDRVDNLTMGLVFEDLIRRFNEAANETAGDHFTPREVIRLMVNLLLEPDGDVLAGGSPIVTVCDPACGTGGMLAEAQSWIRTHNAAAIVKVFGQDYNPRSFAVAASDMLIKGHKDSRIEFGNSLTAARFEGFDYLLANPPFGVDWKAEQKEINKWKDFYGYRGKLPRVNDGALLFLLYMLSKRQPYRPSLDPRQAGRGTRIAIVFNGSPLFTGGAGSGESDIRRWIIEQDWLEAIVALPEQMFYNTGIGTFVWIVTNRKAEHRAGRIQLIDARERWTPMKRSLGDKRRYLDEAAIDAITREHGTFADAETSRMLDNRDFGYRRITVERPLRLRFRITEDARAELLDGFPELADIVAAVERDMGPDPLPDWNAVSAEIERILARRGLGWSRGARGVQQQQRFRACLTQTDPEAAPVIARRVKLHGIVGPDQFPDQVLPDDLTPAELDRLVGLFPDPEAGDGRIVQYETDPNLRDYENIPLKEDIPSFFRREVLPYVPDAWINPDDKLRDEQDGGIGRVGYEINFNRVFFRYRPPRDLAEIDAELAEVEQRILGMLRGVTD